MQMFIGSTPFLQKPILEVISLIVNKPGDKFQKTHLIQIFYFKGEKSKRTKLFMKLQFVIYITSSIQGELNKIHHIPLPPRKTF